MPKVCSVCGKGNMKGCNISHSHIRTNKAFKPNLQKVALVDENGTARTEMVCTRCLKKIK